MHFYTFYKIHIRRVPAKSNELRSLFSKTWIASLVPLKSSLQKPPGLIIINALRQRREALDCICVLFIPHQVWKHPKRGHCERPLINSRHISYFESYLCHSLDGTNAISFSPPQSLGTIAGAGSQAICWCSSVMDGCITALLQPKQLFNQPKRLHLQNHLSFYLEPSVQPLALLLSHAPAPAYIGVSVPLTMTQLF